jgi:hypothetical protein
MKEKKFKIDEIIDIYENLLLSPDVTQYDSTSQITNKFRDALTKAGANHKPNQIEPKPHGAKGFYGHPNC